VAAEVFGTAARMALQALAADRVLRSPKLSRILATALVCALCLTPTVIPLALFSKVEAISSSITGWVVAVYIAVVMASVWCFVRLATKVKRLAAAAAEHVREADPRHPVLLLRSFSDDITPVHRDLEAGSRFQLSWLYPRLWTLEEAIERVLTAWGP
jgi:hypothetical protein